MKLQCILHIWAIIRVKLLYLKHLVYMMLAGNREEKCIKHWNLIAKFDQQTTKSIFLFVQIHNGMQKPKVHWKTCFNMLLMKNGNLVPIGRNNHSWNPKLHLKRVFILGGGGRCRPQFYFTRSPNINVIDFYKDTKNSELKTIIPTAYVHILLSWHDDDDDGSRINTCYLRVIKLFAKSVGCDRQHS